jgi:hypothetical protein
MLPGARVAVIEHVLGENRERGPALRALETASGQDRPIFAPARSRSQGPLSDQVADAPNPRGRWRSWVDSGGSIAVPANGRNR